VEATFEEGLVSPVMMEFLGITVGGGFSGTAERAARVVAMGSLTRLFGGRRLC